RNVLGSPKDFNDFYWPPSVKVVVFYNRERQNRRLDSEHFRFAPRTCGPPCGRLEVRKTERTGRPTALVTHRGGSPRCSTASGGGLSQWSVADVWRSRSR